MGGPLLDSLEKLPSMDGAMFVYNAENREQLIEMVEKDPFISEGLMAITFIRPFFDLTATRAP